MPEFDSLTGVEPDGEINPTLKFIKAQIEAVERAAGNLNDDVTHHEVFRDPGTNTKVTVDFDIGGIRNLTVEEGTPEDKPFFSRGT